MRELLQTWTLLQRLRANVRDTPQRIKDLQDALLRESVLHAYQNVPFYRRYWAEEGFDPQAVRDRQDVERIPIMTREMARAAAQQGELLAAQSDAGSGKHIFTTGSSGHALRVTGGQAEERLWRAQGLRMWFEHGYRWHHKKAQFNLQAEHRHLVQRFGISRTEWIVSKAPGEELRDGFLEAGADWVIATPTVLRRLAGALESTGGRFHSPRGIFCQGELVDTQTKDLSRNVFGVIPVDIYTLSEVGYVAWQCERREGLHLNVDTHLVEVLRNGEVTSPGSLGRIVVTDLRNRTMPFLRYDTGDLAIAGNDNCACGRQFPTLQSIEGRQRDAIQLEDGSVITARALVNHLAPMLPADGYQLHQETTTRFRLELFSPSHQAGTVATSEPPSRPNQDAIVKHLRTLLGNVDLAVQNVAAKQEHGEKTYPVVINLSSPIA